ncbi:HORMA domain protein, putative [Plasmodium vinckei vinckei]|uniref:HORMA domain protein, putative n=1 Tax=Plasmodium vinckei vinckei TaxID=54757 RepID=A0A449BZG3_PLAVN|nr:HORMA domain protein, putative [Plasmodium vinckei vinckei]KEG04345.1 hypothetical protein YYE_01251 [Plasmodium vinckei vinckei]VEV58855.1 HORMA domain protein, putative [Plasmodium vinckei vinckei]
MISRMSVRTHTNVEALTKQDSVNMMKNIIKLGISLVTYLRNLFEERAYEEVCIQELKLKRLLPINSESHMIINWLEKGVFDAIEKEYLRILILDINDVYDNTLECYKFSFSYNTAMGGEIDITLETSGNNDQNNIGNNATTNANNNNYNDPMKYNELMEEKRKNYNMNRLQNIKDRLLNKNGAKPKKEPSLLLKKNAKEKTYELLRSLVLLTQTLSPLPEKTYLSMKLLYYDEIVPYNYQPPYFRNPGSRDLLKFMSMPKENFVGKIDTGHHFLSVIVNSTCNNSTQENSTYDCDSNSNHMESNIKDMYNEYNQNNAIDNHVNNHTNSLDTYLSNNYSRHINKGYTDDTFHSCHHKYCNSTYSKYYNNHINKYHGNYTNIYKTHGYESEQSRCCSHFHDEDRYEYLKNYLKKYKRKDDKNNYAIIDDDEYNKTLEQNYYDHTYRSYKNWHNKHYPYTSKMEQYFTQNNEYIASRQKHQLNKIKKNKLGARIRKTNINKLLAASILNNTHPDDSIIDRKRKEKTLSLARILKSNNYPEYTSNSESDECCVKLGKIISQNNIIDNDDDNEDDCVQVEKREIGNYKNKKNKYLKKMNNIQAIQSNYPATNTYIDSTPPLKNRKRFQNDYMLDEANSQSSPIKITPDKLLQEKELPCEGNDIQMNIQNNKYIFSEECDQISSSKFKTNTKQKIRNRNIDKEKQRIINQNIATSKKNRLLSRIKVYITRYKILDASKIQRKIPTASDNDINIVINNLVKDNILEKNADDSYNFINKGQSAQKIKSTSTQKNKDLNYQNNDEHLQNGNDAHNISIMLDQQKLNIHSKSNDTNFIDKSSNEQSDTKNLETWGKDIDKTKYPISNVYGNSKNVTNPANYINQSYLPTNNMNKLSMQKGNKNEISKITENNEMGEASEINNDIQKLYDDVYSLCQKTKYVNKEIITKGLGIYPLLSKPLINRLMKEGVLKKKFIKNKGYESNIFVPIESIFQGNKSSNPNENVLTEN